MKNEVDILREFSRNRIGVFCNINIRLYTLPGLLILLSVVLNDGKSAALDFAHLSIFKVALWVLTLLVAATMIFDSGKIQHSIRFSHGSIVIIFYLLLIFWVNFQKGFPLNILFEKRVSAIFFYFFCSLVVARKNFRPGISIVVPILTTVLIALVITWSDLFFLNMSAVSKPNAVRGPFMNSSHLATFLVMSLPFVISLPRQIKGLDYNFTK